VRAIKKLKNIIQDSPDSAQGLVFARLLIALERGDDFQIKDLYDLSLKDFELAIELMRDWRIDSYYVAKSSGKPT